MNSWGSLLIWGVLQITLFTLIGAAVYLLARRRGPAAGSLVATAALALVMGVSLLAYSPWPRWWSAGQGVAVEPTQRPTAAVAATVVDQTASVAESEPRTNFAPPAVNTADQQAVYLAVFNGFIEGLKNAPVAEKQAAGWRWPSVVAAVLMLGVMLGLTRLIVALVTVTRYRRRTTVITDAGLVDLLEELRAELRCLKQVELRESKLVITPATVGWRRPMVMLPANWREWTSEERRVVLAHELSHVARGDYAAWLLAQTSLALHFYHPLVHWLVSRLRLEQELAADRMAANVSGGGENYLATLARMALRQDDLAVSWAARPFLPERGTFMRRIQMLRDSKQLRGVAFGATTRTLLLASLAMAAIIVSGLRGPDSTSSAAQAAEKPAKGGDKPPVGKGRIMSGVGVNSDAGVVGYFVIDGQVGAEGNNADDVAIDLSYIPDEVMFAAVIRPAEILTDPAYQPLVKIFNQVQGKSLGLPAEQIAEIRVVQLAVNVNQPPRPMPFDRLVLRSTIAHDWKLVIDSFGPTSETNLLGNTYYRYGAAAGGNQPVLCYYRPDDKTVAFGPETEIQKMLAFGNDPGQPAWADQWKQVANGQFAVYLDPRKLVATMQMPVPAQLALFSPLWQHSQNVTLGGSVREGVQVNGRALCTSQMGAEQIHKTLEALLTLAGNGLKQTAAQMAARPSQSPEQQLGMSAALKLGETLLKGTKVNQQEDLVAIQIDADVGTAPMIALLMPALQASREAARRSQSANNLKQIGLGFHNYHDVYKHFPGPKNSMEAGKPPHSWRVAILPYLDQGPLYEQYNFDEPWDSENNKKLIEKMPAIYRSPSDMRPGFSSSYYVLDGKPAMFADGKPTGMAEITDGTSNTILAVEGQADFPWTKPEDLAYDPTKPLPKLGGFSPKIFSALFGDGSVRIIAESVNEKTLRSLISKDGGEVTEIP